MHSGPGLPRSMLAMATATVTTLFAAMPRIAVGQTQLTVSLSGSAASPKIAGGGTGRGGTSYDLRRGAVITINCSARLPCDGPPVTLRDSASGRTNLLIESTPTAKLVGFTLPANGQAIDADYTFELLYGNATASPRLHLHGAVEDRAERDADNGDSAATPAAASLTELVSTACPEMEWPQTVDLVVRPDGSMLRAPSREIKESDDVTVVVYGDDRLLPQLRVKRESAIRVPKLTNIAGANVELPKLPELVRHERVAPTCAIGQTTHLGQFAPGTGVFDISAITDKGYVSTGKVELDVAPLYTGAFSFGAVYTTVQAPDYGYVFDGKDTVVTESGTRGRRMLYVLQYTPFIWGPRALTLRGQPVSVYPSLGLVLNDVANNALAGVSLMVGHHISITAGLHAARVSELDPRSGLQLQSRYDVATRGTTVPTVKHWTAKPCYGIAIDLEAATSFLHALLGTATPKS